MTPRDRAAVTLHPAAETLLRFGVFRFDRANGLLWRDGEELPLPPRALAVLSVLVERAGRVVSKQELLEVAWNGAFVTETSLSEAVSLLRQTLGDDSQQPTYIQTVHRRGYRFIAPLEVDDAPPREPLVMRPAAWRPAAALLVPSPAPLTASDEAVVTAQAREWTTARVENAAVAASVSQRPTKRRLALALGLVALLLAALAGAFLAGRRTAASPQLPPTRFAFASPTGWKPIAYRPSLAVSPDGRQVVFAVVDDSQRTALFVRDLGGLESRALAGTGDARTPFVSPDGRSVGFFADGQLKRVELAGGPVATIAPAEGEGGSWGEDGTIVFAAGRPTALFRVAASGGTPQRLSRPDAHRGECQHLWPQLLPGGEGVLFTAWSTTLYDARVEWLSLRDGERRTLVTGGGGARYAGGRLLWARPDGAVVAAPFDPRAARLLGPPAPLLANVVPFPFDGFAQLAVGGDTLVYLSSGATPPGDRRLVRLDGDTERPLPTPTRYYRNLKTGPGGRLAATLLARDRSDVWVVDPGDGALTRLTFDSFNIEPTWSPDGKWVAYSSNRPGPFNIFRRRVDGSAPAERLLASTHHQHPTSWSPDGRELMMGDVDPETGFDLWVLDLASHKPRVLVRTPADEIYAVSSPDGRWFAYCSDESGRFEVIARSYPDLGGRWQLSTEGGFDPFWSTDGGTLYFHRDGDVWGVSVAPAGRELNPGAARRVSHSAGLQLASAAPGGGLYAILEQRSRSAEESPREVRVVLGWPASLTAH